MLLSRSRQRRIQDGKGDEIVGHSPSEEAGLIPQSQPRSRGLGLGAPTSFTRGGPAVHRPGSPAAPIRETHLDRHGEGTDAHLPWHGPPVRDRRAWGERPYHSPRRYAKIARGSLSRFPANLEEIRMGTDRRDDLTTLLDAIRDGRRLASASADGTVKVWDGRPLDAKPAKPGPTPS